MLSLQSNKMQPRGFNMYILLLFGQLYHYISFSAPHSLLCFFPSCQNRKSLFQIKAIPLTLIWIAFLRHFPSLSSFYQSGFEDNFLKKRKSFHLLHLYVSAHCDLASVSFCSLKWLSSRSVKISLQLRSLGTFQSLPNLTLHFILQDTSLILKQSIPLFCEVTLSLPLPIFQAAALILL